MPAAKGITHKKSIVVPWTVKILWKVSESEIIWLPGKNSSDRIDIARAPPSINAVRENMM